MTTAKKITLNINLADELFAGLGRRKYTDKYTKVPVRAYGEDVTTVMSAFYKLLGLELTDETACIGVVASEQGFPQRVVGPKVYQAQGVLGVKVGSELYSFSSEINEDGEVKLSLNGKAVTLMAEGKNPIFKVAVGLGNFIKLPVYMNFNESTQSYSDFSELEAGLNDPEVIAQIVGEIKAKGEKTGSIAFSDLKSLPIGKYQVLSAKNVQAKYGPTVELYLKSDVDLEMATQNKDQETGKWETALGTVLAGTAIKVAGNTALKASLMGTELKESNNVYLDVIGQRDGREGKIIVDVALDYDSSDLKFEF